MLRKAKIWYQSISRVGKIALWSASAAMVGTIIASANPATSSQPAETGTAQSAPQEDKKEPTIEKKTIATTSDIAFVKKTIEDTNLDKGSIVIHTVGVKGVKTSTYEVTYEDGIEKDKRLIKEEVTKAPVAEVTAKGTKVAYVPPPAAPQPAPNNCHPNYSPCIPSGGDLDCPEIGHRVSVHGADPYRLDADNDGTGCDSY